MHPYRQFASRQFWSRSVARDFAAHEIGTFPVPLIRQNEKVVSAGSCFAANMPPYLERNGFHYLRTEFVHPIFAGIAQENMGYAKYSAGYGNMYTARQLHQLLLRALGRFQPVEDRWIVPGAVIDPFRPGLRYPARTPREYDLLTTRHLQATRQAFSACDVFVFTLGLTEAWFSRADNAVFPACPGTIAGEFDPQRHAFVNFTVGEVECDLQDFIRDLREINPSVRVILTVSPVPLVATASDRHVLAASTYSKSILRVAAEQVSRRVEGVHYFPAYEIVTGPQAPHDFFESDRRRISDKGIEAVMSAFLAACEAAPGAIAPDKMGSAEQQPRPTAAGSLSNRISDIECEEAGQDIQQPSTKL